MDSAENIEKSFKRIIAQLTPAQRGALQAELLRLEATIKELIRRCWWLDPGRKAQVQAAMRTAGKARRQRTSYLLTYRGTGAEYRFDTLTEPARIVKRAVKTVELYLSRGGGTASFTVNDEVVTVKRVK